MELISNIGGERINNLRNSMLIKPELCVERGYHMTEAYKETENEPQVIRRAKAVKKILENLPVVIDDEELIVGRASSKKRGGLMTPELNSSWYADELDLLSTREIDTFAPVSEEEKKKVKEFMKYWKGRSLFDMWQARIPKDILRLNNFVQGGGAFCGNNQYYGHSSADFEIIINKGIAGLKQDVAKSIAGIDIADMEQFKKYHFLTAMNIVLDAVAEFAERYAEKAAAMAEKENDKKRKAELELIADTCRRVPMNPARNFFEAMQSMWFAFVMVMIEGIGTGNGFGRVDQYLYPFYKKDIEEGRLSKDTVRELIEMLYINCNGLVIPYSAEGAKFFAGLTLGANFVLGGMTSQGKDAVNELSYIFLEAEKEVALNSEDIIVRINKKTPDAFVIKACEVAKALGGKIKFHSDETIIQQLMHDGKPVELARNYGITGCNTPTVPGYSLDVPGGMVNMPLILELALNNGKSRITGLQLGAETGDPRSFKSYEDVWNAFKTQVEKLMPAALLFRNVDKELFPEYLPIVFQSSLFHETINKGLDCTDGGTDYATYAISLTGTPNVGDSLAAIKKVVFDDKRVSMETLIDSLDKNFEGYDDVLQLLSKAPKFGNNIDYVDSVVNDVLSLGYDEVSRKKTYKGAVSNCAAGAVTANVPLGFIVGALPDGRKAGTPLSEGGISPYQGRNISGPTATLMSVAKLDHTKFTNGSVLNMRFSPDALKDMDKIKKFASMIRTYCELGGFLVQFNIVSTDTLRKAQEEPEKYKDLLVRVATYSAYFVELPPELQNDIINRMEFQEV